tara:strand:- start:1168 stop:1740 length:573 start_codon:yes stop_codon:yes gene_type:complete
MDQKPGIRKTPTVDLTLHPDNPRQGDIGAIIESIEANGWFGTLVAQCSTGHVLAGNHRLQAASHLDIDKVPVHWVDVDDEAALRILLADNRTSDLATNDDAVMAELLTTLATTDIGLPGTGYDGDDLDLLLQDEALSLGDLADEYGENHDDLFVAFRVRLPPELHDALMAWWDHLDGDTDINKAKTLLGF